MMSIFFNQVPIVAPVPRLEQTHWRVKADRIDLNFFANDHLVDGVHCL
jgi:hypothetical protein